MRELESSRHLFQPTLYRAEDGTWHKSYADAVSHCGDRVTWDGATALAILSFAFPCGDRTLIKEVTRRPWLSGVGPDGEPQLEPIPPHDTLWLPYPEIAAKLADLLCEEALQVCQGRSEIYILLSGGLDSRVVAGVLARLIRQGRLNSTPVGVVWGLPGSRDVVYSRAVADLLGFGWEQVDITPEDIIRNTDKVATSLGGLLSPQHLHGMMWFESVSRDAIVLAASYGDSVGRAEFSGRHLLELSPLRPTSAFGLLKPTVLQAATRDLLADFKALHERSPGVATYALCDHERQAHYMRSMLGHAMALINEYCTLYQMFTHPKVYSYMWSIHPSLRCDAVYAELLEELDPELARLPWARTNRALRGRTRGAHPDATRNFHDYPASIRGPVYDALHQYFDPGWFEATGLFDARAVRSMEQEMSASTSPRGAGYSPAEIWLWLVAFRRFADWLGQQRRKTAPDHDTLEETSGQAALTVAPSRAHPLRRWLRGSRVLCGVVRAVRRFYVKWQARWRYPPRSALSEDS